MSNVVHITGTPEIRLKAGEKAATEDQSYALDRIASLKDSIDEMEEERKSLTSAIIHSMGEDRCVRWSGGKATIVSVAGRESVSIDGILAERPDLFELIQRHTKRSDPYSYIRLGR